MADDSILTGLRVLVVEDEYFLADDLKRLLRAGGAESVKLSGSLNDATTQLRGEAFELALVDVNLRGESALPVADELMRLRIPFGFVSGYDRDGLPDRFRSVPFWRKPLDQTTFLQEVRRVWKGVEGRSP